jgi:hypothetical protein
MKKEEIINKVEKRINQLIEEFKKYPEKFLTEEDLRSYLYHLLVDDFNIIQDCEDNSKSIPLHCEVRWYGNSGKLRLRSDIVILDVSTLITKNIASFKLPSKGYGFNKPLVIIEIKLRRKTGDSDNKFKRKITRDVSKLKKIKKGLNSDFNSYVLIFDKRKNLSFETDLQVGHKEYYIYPYSDRSLRK